MHMEAIIIATGRKTLRRRGFTIWELSVVATCLLIGAGLLTSLGGASRTLSQTSQCTANLETLFGGLTAYVNVYNSYPPHNPYPRWTTEYASKGGFTDTSGIDPNIGWIMTYGLAMTPPATDSNGHFEWWVLNPDQLPSVCVCPAASYNQLFTLNPEIDTNNPETFVYQYAAFYQTSGTCRCGTPLTGGHSGASTLGGRNPPIPDPTSASAAARQPALNTQGVGPPYVWLYEKTGDPTDPSQLDGQDFPCWIQAVHPAEVQEPGRVYYLADSRDYRPDGSFPDSWPPAATSDGWYNGYGNKIFMSTRHYGFANVMYLDGQVNRDNQAHSDERWNMAYNGTPGSGTSSQWRCATFADNIPMAKIGTQHHIMPVLMVKSWEAIFTADGIEAK